MQTPWKAPRNIPLSEATPQPPRYRPVFASEEKENLPPGCRLEGVQVLDDTKERPGRGAALNGTLSNFLSEIKEMVSEQNARISGLEDEVSAQNAKISAQNAEMSAQRDEIGKLKFQVSHMEGRLSQSSEIYNEQVETIEALREKNASLTLNRQAIDEMVV